MASKNYVFQLIKDRSVLKPSLQVSAFNLTPLFLASLKSTHFNFQSSAIIRFIKLHNNS